MVSGGQCPGRHGHPGRRGRQRADPSRPWPAAGPATVRAQAGLGGGRAGRGRVRAGRADPGHPAPAQRPADRRPGPAPARLPRATAHPGRHRRLGGDRVPGVLQAALRRVLAEPAATAVGSAVFGLWHIRPTAEALAVNRLAAGRGAQITAVTAVAAGTAGAGALLSLLRERSGSLAAPVLLHLAANCAAPLASALARPTDRRGPGRTRRPGRRAAARSASKLSLPPAGDDSAAGRAGYGAAQARIFAFSRSNSSAVMTPRSRRSASLASWSAELCEPAACWT